MLNIGIPSLKDSIVDDFIDIFGISLGKKQQCISIMIGGHSKVLSLWILSNVLQKIICRLSQSLLTLNMVWAA